MEAHEQQSTYGRSRMGQPARYRLRIAEHLDAHWSESLGQMTIGYPAVGGTVLEGELVDQAALYGLISRLRDLGLTLLALQRVSDDGGFESF